MRVLLACDWFLKYAAGLAGGLSGAGADVMLLCRDHDREFAGRQDERQALLDALADRGVEIVVLPGRTSSGSGLAALPGLRRRIVEWAPAVVHAQSSYEPRLLALSLGFPCVLTVHDPEPHPGQPRPPAPQRAVAAAWLRHADRIVVHGAPLRAALPPHLRSRAVVIPHGLSLRSQPMAAPAERAVLLLGRLEPYKGVHVLIDAMAILWQTRDDVRLIVAGRGPAGDDVPADRRIERHLAYVPEAELDGLLARASLVVLPYTEASQSGVGALAVAAGVPVIVSDVGALAEIAVDPSFVVPAGDPEALAAAILRHVDDDGRTRQQVWDLARRTLSWDVVAARHLSLYESMVRRPVPR